MSEKENQIKNNMKKLLFLICLLINTGCTVIKIYSGNPPYYTSSTDIYFRSDSTLNTARTQQDSVKVVCDGKMIIIRNGEFDILGRKIK